MDSEAWRTQSHRSGGHVPRGRGHSDHAYEPRGRGQNQRWHRQHHHRHDHRTQGQRPNPVQGEVNALFDKAFVFEKPAAAEEWSLPSCDSLFPETSSENSKVSKEEWNQTLSDLRSKLRAVQSNLSDKDIETWHAHTSSTHRGGLVIPELRKRFHTELGTQAWCKFHEILTNRHLIPDQVSVSKPLHSIHICEAPGAFVCSLNHYLRTHREREAELWKWLAASLNPHCESNRPDHTVVDDRLILQTPDCWYFGEDDTGDVMSIDNLRGLQKLVKIKMHGSVSLVTADGSINCQDDPARQEQRVFPLLFCQTVTALQTLDCHGNFLIKMFTMYSANTACLMYLLNCTFREVTVVKPACSKAGNSEVYMVCKEFVGRDKLQPQLECFLQHFGSDVGSTLLFHPEHLPPSFITQLERCSELFTKYQTSAIAENLHLYASMEENKRRHLNLVREQCLETYIRRCHMRAARKHQKLIPNVAYKSGSMFAKNLHNRLHGSLEQREEEEQRTWEQQLMAIQQRLLETGTKAIPGPRVDQSREDTGIKLRLGPGVEQSEKDTGTNVRPGPALDQNEGDTSIKLGPMAAGGPGGGVDQSVQDIGSRPRTGLGMEQIMQENENRTGLGVIFLKDSETNLRLGPVTEPKQGSRIEQPQGSNCPRTNLQLHELGPGGHAQNPESLAQDQIPGCSNSDDFHQPESEALNNLNLSPCPGMFFIGPGGDGPSLRTTVLDQARNDFCKAADNATKEDSSQMETEMLNECTDASKPKSSDAQFAAHEMPMFTWDSHGSCPPQSWKVIVGQPLKAVFLSPLCATHLFLMWRKLRTSANVLKERKMESRVRSQLTPGIISMVKKSALKNPAGSSTSKVSERRSWLGVGLMSEEMTTITALASECNLSVNFSNSDDADGPTLRIIRELLLRNPTKDEKLAALFVRILPAHSSVGTEPLEAELSTKHDFIAACLLAFKALDCGGSFFIWVPSLLTRFSACLLDILCMTFDHVTLVRGQQDDLNLPCVLISCAGYYRNRTLHEYIQRVYDQMVELQHVGTHDVLQFIPMINLYNPGFDKTLAGFNETLLLEDSLHMVKAELAAIGADNLDKDRQDSVEKMCYDS